MARKMKKFSAGGAQGRYEHRMKDIEKDRKIALAKGKNADVVEAKAAQRRADAEDDRAKRMGTDRTATRKAEYDAEQRLSRTRRFGADKPAAAAEPAKASTPEPVKASEPAKAKPKSTREEFNAAFRAARNDPAAMKRGTFTFKGTTYTTKMAGEGPKRTVTANPTSTNNSASTAGSNTNNSATPPTTAEYAKTAPKPKTTITPLSTTATNTYSSPNLLAALRADTEAKKKAAKEKADKDKAAKTAENVKRFTSRNVQSAYGAANMAKGGKVKKEKTMKYAKGGSTPPQPTPADRARSKKQLDELKKLKPTDKEGKVAGSANRSEGPGYKKGGKMATKFGAAMKKKSADTKGRAMPKFAKGGSIDGCAVKGKTKTSMIKMKNGGSC